MMAPELAIEDRLEEYREAGWCGNSETLCAVVDSVDNARKLCRTGAAEKVCGSQRAALG